jgi:toxin ParE1/3/4
MGLEFFYASLQRNPDAYSYYEKPVRQGILDRFPYTVVYETLDEVIVVYSVFMFRQNPKKKRSR